jgi:hypothetical protein
VRCVCGLVLPGIGCRMLAGSYDHANETLCSIKGGGDLNS